jgi:hypothetical protein
LSYNGIKWNIIDKMLGLFQTLQQRRSDLTEFECFSNSSSCSNIPASCDSHFVTGIW